MLQALPGFLFALHSPEASTADCQPVTVVYWFQVAAIDYVKEQRSRKYRLLSKGSGTIALPFCLDRDYKRSGYHGLGVCVFIPRLCPFGNATARPLPVVAQCLLNQIVQVV